MICKYIWIYIYVQIEACLLNSKNAKKHKTKKPTCHYHFPSFIMYFDIILWFEAVSAYSD